LDIFEDSNYCILHIDLPSDEKTPEFIKINQLKNEEVKNRIRKGKSNFKGIKLQNLYLSQLEIKENVEFTRSNVKKDVKFNNSKINGDIWFDGAYIGGNTYFESAEIHGSISFYGSIIKGDVWFDKAHISKYSWFEKVKIGGETSFNEVIIGGSVSFEDSKLNKNLSFHGARIKGNAWFNRAKIYGNTWIDFFSINGELNFKETTFMNPKSQEKCCRKAKSIWEKRGDREKSDYYFYREMEAKRKQKPSYIQYLETIVQYPFGYGVYPYRLLITFVAVLLSFTLIFWIIESSHSVDSLVNNFRFSFLTMIIPAYGVINAKTGVFGLLTILEAIIGAFTWPTFIVVFARKYMR
jgi:hypothetical protein